MTNLSRAIAVDYLRKVSENQSEREVGVACIYCNYKERQMQTSVNLLASIWMQLIHNKGAVSDKIKALYKNHIHKGTRPDLRDMSGILRKEVDEFDKIYVLVDALDECADDDSEVLIEHLKDLQPKLNLMITSRPSNATASLLEEASLLTITAHPSDLLAYITGRIDRASRLTRHVKSDTNLAEEIGKGVAQSADDMYEAFAMTITHSLTADFQVFARQTSHGLVGIETHTEERSTGFEYATQRFR